MVLNRPVELDIRHSAVYLVARIDMHADIWHGFTSHPHTRTHTHAPLTRVFLSLHGFVIMPVIMSVII